MTGVRVHPTAIIDSGAELADDVVVGPFCHVGASVRIGSGSELGVGAVVFGPTVLGRRNRVHAFAVLGGPPQDRSYRGEATELIAGDDNEFREHVTVNRGTTAGGGVTLVGSGCLFMAGVHVAHDCSFGDRVTVANGTSFGGHVRVESRVTVGGHVAVAPFVTVGFASFIAGGAMVDGDVPPFVIAAGDRARPRGLNRVGMKRAEVPRPSQRALARAYRRVYASGEPVVRAARVLETETTDECVRQFAAFVAQRAGVRPRRRTDE